MYIGTKLALAIILVTVLCMVPMFAFHLVANSTDNNYASYKGGPSATYPISADIDEALKPYINVTTVGQKGANGPGFGWMKVNGTVSWIGSTQGSIKSLQNIDLVMYTRLDENVSLGPKSYLLVIGSHVQAYSSEPTIPTDSIDHCDVVIPVLGLDTPQYQFSLNCSTYVK